MPKDKPKNRAKNGRPERRSSSFGEMKEWQRNLLRDRTNRVDVFLGSALGIATFQKCVQLISRKIAETPILPMRQVDKGWAVAVDYPTYRPLKFAPNSFQAPYTFWATMIARAVATGLGLAEIHRENGRITGFNILDHAHPRVDVERNGIVYDVQGRTIDARNCLEIRGITFDGIRSHSPIDLANSLLETRIAENQYQAALYRNGAAIKGILRTPGHLDEEQAALFGAKFDEKHAGADNAARTPVLSGGFDFQPLEHSPADVGVVESAKHGVSEVARLLNVPGWIVDAPDAIKPVSDEQGMAQRLSGNSI